MSKRISELSTDPFLVRLSDRPVSLFLSGKDGKILIDEGEGPDRLNGAVIYADQSPEFSTENRTDGCHLCLACGPAFTLDVGLVGPNLDVESWVEGANTLIKLKHRSPPSQTPSGAALPPPAVSDHRR